MKQIETPSKTCLQCGISFSRVTDTSNSKYLSPKQWAGIKYCSHKCSTDSKRKVPGDAADRKRHQNKMSWQKRKLAEEASASNRIDEVGKLLNEIMLAWMGAKVRHQHETL